MSKAQTRIECIKPKRLRVREAAAQLAQLKELRREAREEFDRATQALLDEIDDDRPLLDQAEAEEAPDAH